MPGYKRWSNTPADRIQARCSCLMMEPSGKIGRWIRRPAARFKALGVPGAMLEALVTARRATHPGLGAIPRALGAITSAHFPKFVHHFSNHLLRTSESHGH